MDKEQFALAAYSSARAELVQRLHLRDNLLIVYLTISGTLIGGTIANKVAAEFLLVLPFVGVGFAVLVAQHDQIIGGIGQFCATEIGPVIQSIAPDRQAIPQWDNSASYLRIRKTAIVLRIIGQLAILVVPVAFALSRNAVHRKFPGDAFTWLWYSGLAMAVLTTVPSLYVNIKRLLFKRGPAKRPTDDWVVRT